MTISEAQCSMPYQIHTEKRTTTNGLDGTVQVLTDSATGDRAEVWPALGFNCYCWQVTGKRGPIDVLYAADNLFDDARPTRSGIPILFPFPNRIRAGTFTWDGKEHHLPLNDSTSKNAIHGFACRNPWRIRDQGASEDHAWITGEFIGSVDAAESRSQWPADYRLGITITLAARRLRIDAVVENPDSKPLPFGLGYHPYFRVPLGAEVKVAQCLVQANADTFWELAESLPTGRRLPVDSPRDLTRPRPYSELTLDDVLTCSPSTQVKADGLVERAQIRQASDGVQLTLRTSPAFRELVVFTPTHRQAMCLEPYTCPTDVINLAGHGIDAGLLVLKPGEQWSGSVALEVG